MKIRLKDIPEGGLDYIKTVHAGEIGLTDDDFQCLTPLEVYALIERADEEVIARTQVKGKYRLTCGRCLEPVEQTRDDTFDLYFEISPTTEIIDLGEDIRQELIVLSSSIAFCSQDCKGICSHCGINLNSEKCECEKSRVGV